MSTYNTVPGYTAQTPLVEGRHTGGFLVSQAFGHRSIDRMTLAHGQVGLVGSLVGVVTATGLAVLVNPAENDGSQNAVGILFDNVDATTGDTPCAVVVRDAEVNGGELAFGALTAPQQAAALAQLAVAHVIVR